MIDVDLALKEFSRAAYIQPLILAFSSPHHFDRVCPVRKYTHKVRNYVTYVLYTYVHILSSP